MADITRNHRPTVWLPIPAEEVEGLPAELDYCFWDGDEEFPADPADAAFYVVPYMKGPEVVGRPLPRMSGVRVVQTLSAGVDHVTPYLRQLPPGVRLCNARGVHEASTAELAVALTLAALRGIPRFVRGQDAEEWHAGFYPALADKQVLIVGYGSIGAAVEDRLTPSNAMSHGSPGWPGGPRAAPCTLWGTCPGCCRRRTWSCCRPRSPRTPAIWPTPGSWPG